MLIVPWVRVFPYTAWRAVFAGRAASAGKRRARARASVCGARIGQAAEILEQRLLLATITVNSGADDGSQGELRQAIAAASAGDTIQFASGVTTVDLKFAAGGQLEINKNLTIQLGQASQVTIQGDATDEASNPFRIFQVDSGVTLSITSLTISGGQAPATASGAILAAGEGGIFLNEGTLNISGDVITGGTASAGGGGVFNDASGVLSVTNSTFTGNTSAAGLGGGLSNQGTATISGSTFSGGNSGLFGGAIYTDGTLNIESSTLSGNTTSSNGLGGGIFNDSAGTLTLADSTVAGNTAAQGGGVFSGNAAYVVNSIIAGNSFTTSGSDPDVAGSFNFTSHNLIGETGDASGFTGAGAYNNVIENSDSFNTLGLAALTANGGPTQTLALVPGSPALHSGTASLSGESPPASLASYAAPATDQRGQPPDTPTRDTGAFQLPPVIETVTNGADSGPGSLRQVLAAATAGSTVVFASTVSLVDLTSGQLEIAKNIAIVGPVTGTVTIQGDATSEATSPFRIFQVDAGTNVTMSGLTIQGGVAPATVSSPIIGANAGGGIYTAGTLSLTSVTLSGNSAATGGGIFNDAAGILSVMTSTFTSNTSSIAGGGLDSIGTADVVNSTFSGNSAVNGGGVNNSGSAFILTNSTLAGNAATKGGGFFNGTGGIANLVNTIVAANSAGNSDPDVAGAFAVTDHNLIGLVGDATGFGSQAAPLAGNLIAGTDAAGALGLANLAGVLAPAANGGPTNTVALLPGSPAIAAGDVAPNSTLGSSSYPTPATDQRGLARIVNGKLDIGAVAFITLYVESPTKFTDATHPGAPVNGDTVTWNPTAGTAFSATGPVANLIYGTNAFGSIGAAVAAAVGGEVVEVDAGSYTENVSITQAISLIGAGSGFTTIHATSSAIDGITISGAGNIVTVQGLAITGANKALNASGLGVLNLTDVQSSGNTNGGTIVGTTNVVLTTGAGNIAFDAFGGGFDVSGLQAISDSGVTNLELAGNNAADTFNISLVAGGPVVAVVGNGPTSNPGGDTLVMNLVNVANPVQTTITSDAGNFSAPGDAQVNYTGIANVVTIAGTPLALGPVVINAGSGGNSALSISGSNLNLSVGGTVVAALPAANVTGVTVNGSGANTLTLDYSSGFIGFSGGVTFNGGGTGTLAITGGAFSTETYNFSTGSSGNVQLANFANSSTNTITYTGLSPISNTGTAANVVLNLPAGADGTNLGDQSGGLIRLFSSNGTPAFETTTFANPAGLLSINASGVTDSLSINTQNLHSDLTIHAGPAAGVTIAGALALNNAAPATNSLNIAAAVIAVNAAVAANGGITLNSAGGISENAASGSLSTGGTLNTSSSGGTNLGGNNSVATFTATDNSVNGISLHDAPAPTATLTVSSVTESGGGAVSIVNANGAIQGAGAISTGGNGNITLAASTALTLAANLTTGGTGSALLTATAGAISQTGGAVTTAQLVSTSNTGTTLIGANFIASWTATNNSSGDVNLTDAVSSLTIYGVTQVAPGQVIVVGNGAIDVTGPIGPPLEPPTVAQNAGPSAVSITAASALTVNGPITSSGATTLTGTGIAASQTGAIITLNANVSGSAVVVHGGAYADVINVNVTGGSPVTLDGMGGDNTYNIVLGSLGQPVNISNSGVGTATAVLTGPTAGSTFNISPTQTVVSGSVAQTVTYTSSLTSLTVNGGPGSDTFNVSPSATMAITIDGGAPAPPTAPGDTLALNLAGITGESQTPISPTPASGFAGTFTFTNAKTVSYSQMETLAPAVTQILVRMTRTYNPNTGLHFFTTSQSEFLNVLAAGWKDETTGVPGFDVTSNQSPGELPILRAYNPNNGQHYLTSSAAEISFLLSIGWQAEHNEGFLYPTAVPGSTEIFMLYNTISGEHLYTSSVFERNSLAQNFPTVWLPQTSLGFGFADSGTTPAISPAVTAAETAATIPAAPSASTTPSVSTGAASALAVAVNNGVGAAVGPPTTNIATGSTSIESSSAPAAPADDSSVQPPATSVADLDALFSNPREALLIGL